MALPVANLGYMPSLSTPSHVPTYQVRDPWAELAQAVLAQAAGQAVGNVFQRDYTTQAKNEKLPVDPSAEAAPWWKRAVMGPTTSKDQLAQLRGEQAQTNRARLQEQSANERSLAQITATREEGTLTRAAAEQARLDQIRSNEEMARIQAEAETARHAQAIAAANQRVTDEIEAQERMLQRRLTVEERMNVTRTVMDNIARISMQRGMPELSTDAQGKTTITQPNPQASVDAYLELLRRQGYPVDFASPPR